MGERLTVKCQRQGKLSTHFLFCREAVIHLWDVLSSVVCVNFFFFLSSAFSFPVGVYFSCPDDVFFVERTSLFFFSSGPSHSSCISQVNLGTIVCVVADRALRFFWVHPLTGQAVWKQVLFYFIFFPFWAHMLPFSGKSYGKRSPLWPRPTAAGMQHLFTPNTSMYTFRFDGAAAPLIPL